jgi:hypothetical protein
MVEASQRKRTLIRIRFATTAIREKYPEKKPKFTKNCKGKQASRSSVRLMIAKEKSYLLQQVMESNMCNLLMT